MGISDLLNGISKAFSPKKRTSAVILAAGSGERFSESTSTSEKKQFTEIGGIPVLLRTALAFENCSLIDEIIVVSSCEDIERCRKILNGKIEKLTHIVKGGKTRQESAEAALEAVNPKSEYIAVHDAARCLVTPEIIESVLYEAYRTGAAAAAEPATDTVKYANGGVIENTIDRDHVWLMKTPQVFLANMYRAGVYTARRDNISATDDCMLVERLGFSVRLVDCGRENIKITYPADKIIAEAILKNRKDNKRYSD